MKRITLIFCIAFFISGCKGCNDQGKKITSDDSVVKTPGADSALDKEDNNESKTAEKIKPTGTSAGDTESNIKPIKNNSFALSKIEQFLVPTPVYTPLPGGGFKDASISLTNKMSNATFQTAFVEVTVLNADNSPYSQNFYTVVNIEPGETKIIPIPNQSKGSKIELHVVKIRSLELTNGEAVLTGVHYNQK